MTTGETEKTSLANLLGGAAIERFDDELRSVLENILDPNAGEGARTITLKVKLKPTDDRTRADVLITCQSSLVAPAGVQTLLYVGKDQGQAVAFEYNPEQLKLNLAKKTPVVGIADRKE